MRLHLTNLHGAGAQKLGFSILKSFSKNKITRINEIYTPHSSAYLHSKILNFFPKVTTYKRFFPNSVSRLFETTILSYKFNGPDALLVLGDIPLRIKCSQTVFVQQSHLLKPFIFDWSIFSFKIIFSKLIFRLNINKVDAFIVQSNLMKDKLEATYPQTQGKVYVVKQAIPIWLVNMFAKKKKRNRRIDSNKNNLRLIYPTSPHSYKNYKILSKIINSEDYPIREMIVTIKEHLNPAPHIPWLNCTGYISEKEMIKKYLISDAMIFLSKEESYGLPLVEAMFVGLPIICPDLPYAKSLCGKEAIYFNPDSEKSLLSAIKKLKKKLDKGWRPSWKSEIKNIEKNWDIVVKRMIEITLNSNELK